MQTGFKVLSAFKYNQMNIQDGFVGITGLLLQAATLDAPVGVDFGLEMLSKLGVVGVVFYMYLDLKKRYERLETQRTKDKEDFLKVLDDQQNKMIEILSKD